jgi:hypothetical protein
MTATTYDFEPARWCNDCHQIAVMPERHECTTATEDAR